MAHNYLFLAQETGSFRLPPGVVTGSLLTSQGTSQGGAWQTTESLVPDATDDSVTIPVKGKLVVAKSNGLSVTSGKLSLAVASTTVFGAVKVTAANGLSITTGTIAMALAKGGTVSTDAGTVAVTSANGLSLTGGLIAMAAANSNGSIGTMYVSNSGDNVLQVANDGKLSSKNPLAATLPIVVSGYTITHSDARGYKHVPDSTNAGRILLSSISGVPGWSSEDYATLFAKYMPLVGGTFTGNVSMGAYTLTVPTPSLP
jgi:hypothetical protein